MHHAREIVILADKAIEKARKQGKLPHQVLRGLIEDDDLRMRVHRHISRRGGLRSGKLRRMSAEAREKELKERPRVPEQLGLKLPLYRD